MKIFIITMIAFFSFGAEAHTFPLPTHVPSVLGHWYHVRVAKGDNLAKIARREGVSLHEIYRHNERLKSQRFIQPGQSVLVPNCYWLPTTVKKGEMLVNLATQTMYYRDDDTPGIHVYPVTVGKTGTLTPTGNFYITRKKENPIWYPTPGVRAAYEKRGIKLPFAVPAGRGNPLGKYAIYLNKPTYLIHTAPSIRSLGGRQSAGCIRMYPHDIISFFNEVPAKTPVRIVDIPMTHEDKFMNQCTKSL
jgi:L,D-transpeptidase ErfK/SrfK